MRTAFIIGSLLLVLAYAAADPDSRSRPGSNPPHSPTVDHSHHSGPHTHVGHDHSVRLPSVSIGLPQGWGGSGYGRRWCHNHPRLCCRFYRRFCRGWGFRDFDGLSANDESAGMDISAASTTASQSEPQPTQPQPIPDDMDNSNEENGLGYGYTYYLPNTVPAIPALPPQFYYRGLNLPGWQWNYWYPSGPIVPTPEPTPPTPEEGSTGEASVPIDPITT